jgi:diguanylate cyclase (GGDEF)-like protein
MSDVEVAVRGRVAEATRQVAPFALAAWMAPFTSIVVGGVVRDGAMSVAAALLTLVIVVMVGVLAWSGPRWLHDVCVLGSFAGLTLVVYAAGGSDSGVGVVLLVPVVWMALYGQRRDVLAALAVELGAVLFLSAVDGATSFDAVEVRRAVTFLAVSTLIAVTASGLVERLGSSERAAQDGHQVLAAVAAAARAIREGHDARATVCEAIIAVSGASGALLLEPDGPDHLAVTASAGTVLPPVRIALTDPSVSVSAYLSGQPRFISETLNDPRVNPTLTRLTAARSVLVQPFQRSGTVRGVVVATWPARHLRADTQTVDAVALLADEIGSALERADLLASLNRRASTDPLTGMANRRVWRERLPGMMTAPGPLWVALFDLDFFKAYNDHRGHLAGDALLQALAQAWSQLLRPQDLLVRWGGEEFALALPDCPLASAQEVVERLRGALPDGQTVSAGLACWDGNETIEALMSRADTALYRAKTTGRDRTVPAALATTRDTRDGTRAGRSTSLTAGPV